MRYLLIIILLTLLSSCATSNWERVKNCRDTYITGTSTRVENENLCERYGFWSRLWN